MDPQGQFCPNPDCPSSGLLGQGNIKVHSHKERRFRCAACKKTFAATKGVTGRVGELHDRTEAARDERTARTTSSGPRRSPGAWPRQSSRPRRMERPPTRPRYLLGKGGTRGIKPRGCPRAEP